MSDKQVKQDQIRAKIEEVLADEDIHNVAILAAPDVIGLIAGAEKLIDELKEYQAEQETEKETLTEMDKLRLVLKMLEMKAMMEEEMKGKRNDK